MPGPEVAIDLSTPKAIHVVGAGGPGMSAIAAVLAGMGNRVSGTDIRETMVLERLRAQGVTIHVPHDPARLAHLAPDAVTYSTAIPDTNPELRAARALDLPVLRRAEILAAITRTRRTMAISGTHGKTTTSSMLALILIEAGESPSFLIGGELNEMGSGAVWADGEWLVVEADESDGTFVEIGAERVAVTNVEADHLDYFGSVAAIEAAFDRFLAQATGPNVVGVDEPTAARLAERHGAVTVGRHPDADYRIVDLRTERAGVSFSLIHRGVAVGAARLPVPGAYNARNAAMALVIAHGLGVPFEAGCQALTRYAGVARRFQFRGTHDGVTFVDDYAHNPGKVAAVLDAAAAGGWGRVVAVFQPHRYSRTAALWREFGGAFDAADLVVLTDVYAAGETARPGVTGKLLVDAVLDHDPRRRVAWLPHRQDLVTYLAGRLRAGDLCLTLGAGDITGLADELILLRSPATQAMSSAGAPSLAVRPGP